MLKELQFEIPQNCRRESRKQVQNLVKNTKKRLAFANIPL